MKRLRKRTVLVGLLFLSAIAAGYFVVPELLVAAGGMLISDDAPVPSDAIVILAGGGPERSREAADLYRADLAPSVVLTMGALPDGYRDLERMGIDLVLPHENDARVLTALGVPESAIVRMPEVTTETLDELTKVRALALERGWTRLIVVTSNYHTRRVGLIARYVFEGNWQVGVVGSRYSGFRPEGWWREVGDTRTFLVEFEKLLLYEIYLAPRIWFGLSS